MTAHPERDVERGWPPLEVEVVALEVRPLWGALTGDEQGMVVGSAQQTGRPNCNTDLRYNN
ncbi:hypothetical protein J6590_046798 [Homalodisca vitripennis]|nr:hypothetical protein J6590_046798 [Homalodisca vitripennis]